MKNFILFMFAVMSVFGVYLTVKDKIHAQKGKRRIPEKHLFSAALLGGAPAMLLTMNIIRHKTQKKKFMLGFPAIIILQILLLLRFW